jgi:phosphoglycerate kinase
MKLEGKSFIVRIDINSPIENNTPVMNERIEAHAETIRYLSKNKAKVVLISHQGRPGEKDFLEDMDKHAELLTKVVKRKVEYVPDVYGDLAIEKIKNMKNGDILLLKNVRTIKEETLELKPKEHAKSDFIKKLSCLFDYFVQDAFSICHRSHASVVGFPFVLPSFKGKNLQKELKGLKKLKNLKNLTCVLGGAKIEEIISFLDFLNKKRKSIILSGGVFSIYCLKALGVDLGFEYNLKEEFLEKIKKYIKKLKIYVPQDFVFEDGSDGKIKDLPINKRICDIGKETIKIYKDVLKKSKNILVKGPLGIYEDERFSNGTKEIFRFISNLDAFSVMCGGNTLDAIRRFGIPKNRFSHISLGGGATIEYISGKKLPGLEVLKKARNL